MSRTDKAAEHLQLPNTKYKSNAYIHNFNESQPDVGRLGYMIRSKEPPTRRG